MTIKQAIEQVDALKYNTYSMAEKIAWLSQLDWDVKRNILELYEGSKYHGNFYGYDQETDPETQLLVPPPYDQMYLRWLEAQIDYQNGEYERYNASILLFNNAFESFERYHKRHHMPVSVGQRFLF